MSKNLSKKLDRLLEAGLSGRLQKTHNPGSRIAPSRSTKNDRETEVRLDAGVLVDGRYLQVYLQVNKEATSPALKKWVQQNGAHANLAQAQFDTQAEDPQAETGKLVDTLLARGKDKIG